jgi:hypothetical protein
MDDPAARYYSPPPPSGLRERLQHRKKSLIAAAVAVCVIGATFGVARIVSGDGKGSGHIERAFGGYISPHDQDIVASITIARNGAQTSYVEIVRTARGKDLKGITRAAESGRRHVDAALADTSRLENEKLRAELTALLKPQREVFVAYGRISSYAASHRGTGSTSKLHELVRRATQAEARAQAATAAFYQHVSAYMTPEQRRQFREEQRAWESEVKAAGG